jgi:hypothetical protein
VNEFDSPVTPPVLPFAPISLGQALDRIWKTLSRRFKQFVQMGTIPAGALLLMYAVMFGALFMIGVFPPHKGTPPDPKQMTSVFFPIMALAFIPMMIVYALFEGAASSAALATIRGTSSSFSEAYGAAWKRLGRLIWLMILRALCIALPIVLVVGVMGGSIALAAFGGGANSHPGMAFVLVPLLVLGYLGAVVYAVWMYLRLALAVPACLDEELTAWEALKRSDALTRGVKRRMFLVVLVLYAINCAAVIVLEMAGFVIEAVITLAASLMHVHLTEPWIGVGVGFLAVALIGAFLLYMTLSWASYAITFSVLYDDQRLRNEDIATAPSGGQV